MSSIRCLLALETSCDETAAAVVTEEGQVLSNVVSSQVDLHARFGGVVPEVASRAHVTSLIPVLDEALKLADKRLTDLSAIAVVTNPGLVGSLLVGLTAAKSLAWSLNLPLISINHIEAHVYACRMQAGCDVFPAIGLVVSGGHTNLYDCTGPTGFELLGSTIDDAAGEAFDKVAAVLGLGYPGGPHIQRVAEQGRSDAFRFPRSFLKDERLEFSFSGLKTAVLYEVAGKPPGPFNPADIPPQRQADLAASFQAAVVEILVSKCRQAMRFRGRTNLCVGGGVAANRPFREALQSMARRERINVWMAPLDLCTDNAAMSAGLAWELFRAGQFSSLDVDVTAGLVRRRN